MTLGFDLTRQHCNSDDSIRNIDGMMYEFTILLHSEDTLRRSDILLDSRLNESDLCMAILFIISLLRRP